MVPIFPGLAGCFLIAAWAGPDPQALVLRLGSAKYAERESASSALEKLGRAAFPALRIARKDPDAEVKNRAEVLLDSIERSMLTRPVTVDLPAGRHQVGEIVERISRAEGLPLQLGEGSDREIKSRRPIVVRSPETLSFWQALDRLGLSLHWDQDADFGRPLARRAPTPKLVTAGDAARSPASDSGPFRMVARPPTLGPDAPALEPAFRGFPPQAARGRRDREIELSIPVELQVEPRLTLRSVGDVRILEAVDQKGHPLQSTGRPSTDYNAPFLNADAASPALTFSLRFHPPSPQARSIRTIRGLVSAEIEARRLDPATVALGDPSTVDQRPLACAGSTIFVRGLANQGGNPRNFYVLELTIRPEDWSHRDPRRGGRQAMNQFANKDFSSVWQCLDVVDAQGRSYRLSTPRSVGLDSDGIRVHVSLTPRDGSDEPPTELRVFGQIRTQVEVPFEFHDLKLP